MRFASFYTLERDVKKDVNPDITSKCWSLVDCCFVSQYKHLTCIMYSQALSMF